MAEEGLPGPELLPALGARPRDLWSARVGLFAVLGFGNAGIQRRDSVADSYQLGAFPARARVGFHRSRGRRTELGGGGGGGEG